MFSGPSTKRSEAEGSCNPICDGGGNGVVENRDRLQIVRPSVDRYERLLNSHISCKSRTRANPLAYGGGPGDPPVARKDLQPTSSPAPVLSPCLSSCAIVPAD